MADETIEIEVKTTTDMSDIESLEQAINELKDSIIDLTVSVDDSNVDDAISKKDELSQDSEFTVNSDDGSIDDAISKKKELEENVDIKVETDTTDFEALSSGLAGLGMSKFGMEAIETAGSISDSWNRLELTFGTVTESMKQSISETATVTGRSGALTRGFFNQMGIAGIKNENGEIVPLGADCAAKMREIGFKMKAVIVKNMEGNERAKGKTANLYGARYGLNLITSRVSPFSSSSSS